MGVKINTNAVYRIHGIHGNEYAKNAVEDYGAAKELGEKA